MDVGADVPTEDPQPSASGRAGSAAKLFLGGLSWETDEGKLQEHFAKYGSITEVIVMRDRITSKPRGFGFISFADEASAIRAMQDSHVIDGRTIDAKPSVPQGDQQRPRSKKIFVGGLAPETTEAEFKDYFEKYGTVLEAQIMVDHHSMRSRGFGFITFEDEASVFKVFAAGSHHELGGKRVEVKNATPKGSGPQGRGALDPRTAYLAGRGMGRGYGDLPFGMGPGYMPAAGYLLPGYGGYMPYGAFPGLVPLGGYGYPGYGAGFGPYAGMQQQQQQQQAGGQRAGSSRPGPTGIPLRAPPASAAAAAQAQLQQQQQQQPGGMGASSSSSGAVGGGSSSLEQLQAGLGGMSLSDPRQRPPGML